MKKKISVREQKAIVKSLQPISSVEFNTNNAWGFGGGIGYESIYSNGSVSRYGTAYFRHLPSEKFERFWTDKTKKHEISKEEFIKAFQQNV